MDPVTEPDQMDDYSGEGGGGGAAADADASYELASTSGPSATTTRGEWEGGAGGAEAPSLQEYLVEEDDPVDSDSIAEDYYGETGIDVDQELANAEKVERVPSSGMDSVEKDLDSNTKLRLSSGLTPANIVRIVLHVIYEVL